MSWLDDLLGNVIKWVQQEIPQRKTWRFSSAFAIADNPVDGVTDIGVTALPSSAYGTGLQGAANFNGATVLGLAPVANVYTMTGDLHLTDCTVAAGYRLDTNGWRLFVTGTLTVASTGVISFNGNAGGNSTASSAGTAAAARAGNTAPGSQGGTAGAAGTTGNGAVGTNPTQPVTPWTAVTGASCGGGGSGQNTGTSSFGAGPSIAGRVLPDLSAGQSFNIATLFAGRGGRGGGSGGGATTPSNSTGGGAGGGGGSGGGVLVFARNIVLAGTIESRGGNGGNGANGQVGAAGSVGGGGPGGGGSGGLVFVVADTIDNVSNISAPAGSSGAVSAGQNGGVTSTIAPAAGNGVVFVLNRISGQITVA